MLAEAGPGGVEAGPRQAAQDAGQDAAGRGRGEGAAHRERRVVERLHNLA